VIGAVLTVAMVWSVVALALLIHLWPGIATVFLDHDAPQSVLATTLTLLAVLAVMQPVDGVGAVVTSILRGVKETRLPMLMTVSGYLAVGMAALVLLALRLDLGVTDLWAGLMVGCVASTLGIVLVRRYRYRRFAHDALLAA
jgi:MATE family multidrug resistance protein